MIEKLNALEDHGSSKRDDVAEIMADVQPAVPSLSAETAANIFDNALRAYSATPSPARRELAGARFVLSAAFCVCSAAGLLLLRSMASVRTNGSQSTPQTVALKESAVPHVIPTELLESRSASHTRSVAKISWAASPATLSRIRSDASSPIRLYQSPPAPVCGLTTFEIFTPLAGMNTPNGDSSTTVNPDDESLLVCIVTNGSADNQTNSSGFPARLDIDVNKQYLPQDGRLLMLESPCSGALAFAIEKEQASTPAQILVGAAIDDHMQINSIAEKDEKDEKDDRHNVSGNCLTFQSVKSELSMAQINHATI